MIFVTLGSQKFPFNRLLQWIDKLIENGIIADDVLAQTGYSTYEPKHFRAVPFMDRDTFAENMEKAAFVITHAGTGAIIGAVKNGKKVIAVPRRSEFGEHVDDHQIQIVAQFDEMGIIEPCYDVELLEQAYRAALEKDYVAYCSNTNKVIASIDTYLESVL